MNHEARRGIVLVDTRHLYDARYRPNRLFGRMRGFTIVELMIAITLSLMILVAVGSIFASSRTVYQAEEGQARLQENARFALEYLTREIRMAGYSGCMNLSKELAKGNTSALINNLNGGALDLRYNFGVPIEGFEANNTAPGNAVNIAVSQPDPAGIATNNWNPVLNANLQNLVIQGTDVVVIHRTGETSLRLVSPFNDGAQLFLEPNTNIQVGDILTITDCTKASVFQVTGTNASNTNITHAAGGGPNTSPGNACTNWLPNAGGPNCSPNGQPYGDGAEVSQAATSIFFVGRGASGNPALFMTSLGGGALQPLELVEGVESMQVLYGVDTTTPLNQTEQYMTATQVQAGNLWPSVVSVRVALLMRTVNPPGQRAELTLDTAPAPNLNGTTINLTAPDNFYRRRIFSTTIELRNRVTGGT